MKYCKNCGMLLENTHERCIKCGADVSLRSNVSMYPPEVEARMAAEKAEQKSKSKMIVVLISIIVILVILIGVIIWKIAGSGMSLPREQAVETVEETATPTEEEPVVTEEAEPEPEVEKDVKDDEGSYYICAPEYDAGGNHIFNAIYPEDISQVSFNLDTEKYSNQFPENIVMTVANDDSTVTFTYMSPQQLWYKKSDKGQTRKNERDPQYYMSFLTYEDAGTYLESLIKASYPKARKIEMISETEVSSELTSALSEFSESRKNFFLNEKFGDYAHLGKDTEYASNGVATYSAEIFEYQITDQDKEVLYCKYYVPVISNTLLYATESAGDMGSITEWYVLCVCGFETGNDMLYEDYEKAFEIFCANACPTREFFYTNYCYGKEIEESIEAEIEPELLDDAKLKEYAGKYKTDTELGDIREGIYSFLKLYGRKVFSSEDMTIYAPEDIAVAYYDKEAGRLFVSPEETEYPGSSYEELTLQTTE